MAINRTPVLKRCRQLGIDPVVLGYSSKKESIRQPKRRRKESEYAMQLRRLQQGRRLLPAYSSITMVGLSRAMICLAKMSAPRYCCTMAAS